MQQADAFRDLMRRVRAGDGEAAAELVRCYEKEVRRAIRIRLTDPRLRRTLDSLDICNSVLGNFFVRVAAGQYDLDQPDQLLKLLVVMAQNKLKDKARHEQAERRDGRRCEDAPSALNNVPDPRHSPSRIVADRDLLQRVRDLLSPSERDLWEQRAGNRSWDDLARERHSSPEALRKQLARALDRVTQQLGMD